jgi:hypothetical protein
MPPVARTPDAPTADAALVLGDWRAKWQVWGRYRDAVLDGRAVGLRSHLEIVATGMDPRAAIGRDADLVAVMMNPGGSRPLAALDKDGWAPALPDRTQLQLMRLAQGLGARGNPVRHIRVLNLSDLRTPKSAEFVALLAALTDGRHSLFHPDRHDELARSLGSRHTPVLRAWGLSPAFAALAARAVAATEGHPVFGLCPGGTAYRHPLPQRADLQRAWVADTLSVALSVWPRTPGAMPNSQNRR